MEATEKEVVETFTDLIGKKEELHPDLRPWITKGARFTSLKHPLVYDVIYSPQTNALLNRQYKQKLEGLKEAREEKDYSQFVWLHERPWRLYAFQQCVYLGLDDATYWDLLKQVWIDSENIWQNKKDWRRLLSANRPGGSFMEADETAFLATLPEPLTVYRGYQKGKNYNGLSYTLDRSRAEWFSKRLCLDKNQAAVRTRVVPKSKVFAYTDGRGEKEIIIL